MAEQPLCASADLDERGKAVTTKGLSTLLAGWMQDGSHPAFVIGGAFSGLAGVLYAMLFGIVPLEAISFVFSGNVVFATLIGGSGSLYGPIIGSFVFIWLSESMSVVWARWPLLLGVAFVIVVLFLRGGVVEAWSRFWTWQSSRQKASANPSAR